MGGSKTVLKGFTMKKIANELTFQTLRNMVLKKSSSISVCEPRKFICDPIRGGVNVIPRAKTLSLVYTKRRLKANEKGEMVDTLPYGHCELT